MLSLRLSWRLGVAVPTHIRARATGEAPAAWRLPLLARSIVISVRSARKRRDSAEQNHIIIHACAVMLQTCEFDLITESNRVPLPLMQSTRS